MQDRCQLEILVQPTSSKLIEKNEDFDLNDSCVIIKGKNNEQSPRIKLNDYQKPINGDILIEVTLLTNQHQIHPIYKLKSKSDKHQLLLNKDTNHSCYYIISNYETMSVDLDNLYIYQDDSSLKNESFYHMDKVILKCSAIHLSNGISNYICESVFSDLIELNRELQIKRISKVIGTFEGNEEIFIFTSHIKNPHDIEIQFYELNDTDRTITWTATGSFDPIDDIHNNCAIVFRTPPYICLDTIKKPVKVYLKLYSTSTGLSSNDWAFYYVNDDMNTFANNSYLQKSINNTVLNTNQTVNEYEKIEDDILNNDNYIINDDDDDDEIPSGYDEVDFRPKRTKFSSENEILN